MWRVYIFMKHKGQDALDKYNAMQIILQTLFTECQYVNNNM